MATRQVHVRDIVVETPWSALVRLDLGATAFRFKAGQAVMLGRTSAATKPYSIASSPDVARRERVIEFLIGTKPDVGLGTHLENLVPGAGVSLGDPCGSFGLPGRLTAPRLLLIAGGTGIAPLRSILHTALGVRDPPAITLLYSAQSSRGFAFVREFRKLSRQRQLSLRLTATREAGPSWRGRRGRIQTSWLRQLLRDGLTLCFVCGPSSFVDDMSKKLTGLGVPPALIRCESH